MRLELGPPALLTRSRYWGSTSTRIFSVFLLISEGFSTTQFPAGRGGAGQSWARGNHARPHSLTPHTYRTGVGLTLPPGEESGSER